MSVFIGTEQEFWRSQSRDKTSEMFTPQFRTGFVGQRKVLEKFKREKGEVDDTKQERKGRGQSG